MEDLNFLNEELNKILIEIEKNKELLESEDKEIALLAKEEIEKLREKEKNIKEQISKLKKSSLQEFVIMEIRSGVGGEEAALWARDLFEMYCRFIKKQGWKMNILKKSESEQGGFKEIILEIKGKGAFEILKYEGGVHRVQRVPKTERQGRIHTSTATVAVLKQPTEIELKINPSDLKIEYKKASGHGGQYVNKRMSAVRITHLPTGLTVSCQSERSQLQNKEKAMEILYARLEMLKEKEKQSEIEKIKVKKEASFSNQIRSYVFDPYKLVKDHRTKVEERDVEKVLEGNLEKFIEAQLLSKKK